MTPPPQKNSAFPTPGNSDVMNAMKKEKAPPANKQVEQAKQQLLSMMQEEGVTPEQMMELGRMAQASIKDKKAYPMFIQTLIKFNLADPKDFRGDIDYQALAIVAAASKLIQTQVGAA